MNCRRNNFSYSFFSLRKNVNYDARYGIIHLEYKRKGEKFLRKLTKFLETISVLCLMGLVKPIAAETVDIVELTKNAGYEVNPEDKPKSSIVVDAYTGRILWQDNIDEERDPASISKVMTVYLVMEAIQKGELSLSQKIVATKEDAAISNIYAISNNTLVEGVEYPIEELIKMTLVPSSNAATIMLANAVEKDSAAFIGKMNAKAKELGMNHTTFNNASGAVAELFKGYYQPEGYDASKPNQTTARDLAILAMDLMNRYPQVLQYTNSAVVKTMEGTPYEEKFDTYNYSLPGAKYGVEGVNGLKTGSSGYGAFNYIATYEKDQMKLVEVVLGVGDWSNQAGEMIRHTFGNAILNYVLEHFSYQTILPAGEHNFDGHKITTNLPLQMIVEKGKTPEWEVANKRVSIHLTGDFLKENQKNPSVEVVAESGFADLPKEPEKRQQTLQVYIIQNAFAFAVIIGGSILFLLVLFGESRAKNRRKHKRK